MEAGEEEAGALLDTFTTRPGLQQLGNSEEQTCHTATADRRQEYTFTFRLELRTNDQARTTARQLAAPVVDLVDAQRELGLDP